MMTHDRWPHVYNMLRMYMGPGRLRNLLILMNILILMNNTVERHFAGRRPVTDMEVYDET